MEAAELPLEPKLGRMENGVVSVVEGLEGKRGEKAVETQ